jgi:sugar phosphate isomerase/epimerase
MRPLQILPSTTSHKHEPLEATLEVFRRLGFDELDLNLWHIIEEGVPVATVRDALRAGHQQVALVSGGWCDFFDSAPAIEETFRSVGRQVALARELGVTWMRLFYGRLTRADYDAGRLATIAGNMRRLSDEAPDMTFVFENHDGASLRPEICREILESAGRPNVRMNFDPINFERAGVASAAALATLRPFVAHVHLKGCRGSECCEFGSGDVDLTPTLRALIESGYRGAFTVEYEGPGDRTLRLYQSVQRAHAALGGLAADFINIY